MLQRELLVIVGVSNAGVMTELHCKTFNGDAVDVKAFNGKACAELWEHLLQRGWSFVQETVDEQEVVMYFQRETLEVAEPD